MSLIDFIQKIQKKPRYLRLQILWLAVFVCIFFIVSLWVISLKHSFPQTAEKAETSEEISQPLAEIKEEPPSLKEVFKASIGAFFEIFEETPQIEQAEQEPAEEEMISEEIKDTFEGRTIKPAKLPLSQ